jgi:hypothetical protein
MTKVAAKKTAGVLGDDLALNAEQVSGVKADRELPVVWAVAKGSALNKLILVPSALAISAFLPWLITPLLMVGGLYLCFEGVEKIAHPFLHGADEDSEEHEAKLRALEDPAVDIASFEKDKIKGAIRTDMVLSAEIIVIALGTVKDADFISQVIVVSGIAAIMTVGVYGLVAGIVKLDDAGLYLLKTSKQGSLAGLRHAVGRGLLLMAPYFMKTLSVVGTVAMFMVGGGILVHGITPLHHAIEHLLQGSSGIVSSLVPLLANTLLGLVAGALALACVLLGRKMFGAGHTT